MSSESDQKTLVKVISLKYPKKKMNYLNKFGLTPEWYKGVDGSKDTDGFNPSAIKFRSTGVIGCALAHIRLWKEFLTTQEERLIVFEDDVILVKDFKDKLEVGMRHLPADYDICYLGYFGDSPYYDVVFSLFSNPKRNEATPIKIPSIALATHAYMVSRKGAEKLVSLLENKVNDHLDIFIQTQVCKGLLDVYAFSERIAFQTSTYNTLSNNNSNSQIILLEYALSKLEVDMFITAKYNLGCHLMSIGNTSISLVNVVYLLLGFYLNGKIDIPMANVIFLILSSNNLLNIPQVVINYYMFMIPFMTIKGKRTKNVLRTLTVTVVTLYLILIIFSAMHTRKERKRIEKDLLM